MKHETATAISVIGILCLVLVIAGVSMVTSNVIGVNITNDSMVAKVFVWNTEPNISSVVITPSPIDLLAGNTTEVNCTGYVWDYNGWQDVRFLGSTFYLLSNDNNGSDDNNYHYTNNTGKCTQHGSSHTNATCIATFNVWYYANNGTWVCNMTIGDSGINITDSSRNITFNRSNNGTVEITTLLALEAPPEIDYGNLSVTETSGFIPANISNWGNMPINISVRGWGGTADYSNAYSNLSMVCEYGNITIDYERYSINNSLSYANMTNLTSNFTLIPNFELPVRTNDSRYGNDTNTTYWKIRIPLTVGGHCNGTIQFAATATN